jgi:sialate O-acetylesterase
MKSAYPLTCAALLLPQISVIANIQLPAVISDHMVLHQGVSAPIWGWADAGEEVRISVRTESGTGANAPIQTHNAKADSEGKWKISLGKLSVGESLEIEIQGNNLITIKDVLVGEVWLGSGQSNMAMNVSGAKDFEEEKKTADLPRLRMFKEESPAATSEQKLGSGKWVVCSPDTVGTFSATLYFFGREIHRGLSLPVGLINSSVGGTPIESWIAPEAQKKNQELADALEATRKEAGEIASEAAMKQYEKQLVQWKEEVAKARASKQRPPAAPRNPAELSARKGNIGGLFNGKIAPLIPYAIKGVVWYQGEANSSPEKAPFYGAQLRTLVTDWRARWGDEFPFAWAQLPNFAGSGRDWSLVREAMLKTLALHKTGMGINIDIGEQKDIHPKNKQEVGRRLSLWALGEVYGQKVDSTSGPLPSGHKIKGSEIVLTFSHADGGLVAKDGVLAGFIIAGENRQWKPAAARLEGNTVVVSSQEAQSPVAVRYAWENFPHCNLYNGAGLPASPFRTDSWKSQ